MAQTLQQGLVKAVLSGDSLVLITQPNVIPPPEREIRLSRIVAPRMGWKDQQDEPQAWHSRESLRKMILGKVVFYSLEPRTTSATSSRFEYAKVYSNKKDIAIEQVRSGFARVKQSSSPSAQSSQSRNVSSDDELISAEEDAKRDFMGVWAKEESPTAIRPIPKQPYDYQDLLKSWEGKRIEVFIEQVRDGSSFRLLVLPTFHNILFYLAGIQAPAFRRNQESGVVSADEFAHDARYFTESRLLNRRVEVIVEGCDKFQNFFGRILHPAGDIRIELLRAGLAKVASWSAVHTQGAMDLRVAENAAKKSRNNIWKDLVLAPEAEAGSVKKQSEFSGLVVELHSADTLTILDNSTSPKRTQRLYLSSVRVPKYTNFAKDNWGFEARGMVRDMIAGKKVSATVDYCRVIEGDRGKDERVYASVFVDDFAGTKKNIAERLVEAGLATPIRHRAEEDRSIHYDSYLRAEAIAIDKKLRMHSSKPAPKHHIHDVTQDRSAAQNMRPFLERDRVLEGIVEYVVSGSRFKCMLPKHSCMVAVTLSSIRSPQRGPPKEPLYDESVRYAQEIALFRRVRIDIQSIDRGGSLVGEITIVDHSSGGGKKGIKKSPEVSLSLALVSAGFARIHEYSSGSASSSLASFSISPSEHISQLRAAEALARQKKTGIFGLDSPPPGIFSDNICSSPATSTTGPLSPSMSQSSTTSVLASPTSAEIEVTEVISGMEFYYRSADVDLGVLEEGIKSLDLSSSRPLASESSFKKGEYVFSKFSADDTWYRARIENIDRDPDAKVVVGYYVLYIDFGNSEVVPSNRLRPIAPRLAPPVVPAIAHRASLAFIRTPKANEEWYRESAKVLSKAAFGRKMTALTMFRDNLTSRPALLLYPPSTPASLVSERSSDGIDQSVNGEAMKQGLAIVDNHLSAQVLSLFSREIERLRSLERMAKGQRACLWRYGEIPGGCSLVDDMDQL